MSKLYSSHWDSKGKECARDSRLAESPARTRVMQSTVRITVVNVLSLFTATVSLRVGHLRAKFTAA